MSFNKYQALQEAGPGLIFSSINRLQELSQCLLSDCDSWVIKFEQILMHGAFLFGYVSPSRVIWELFKNLLTRATSQSGNLFNSPTLESQLRMGMSLLEQLGLTYIWDFVRDGSLCMRFNNCDNDFLGQLSNIKIKMCNVSTDDLRDDTRKLSVCEKVFNDSPLIFLASGMLLLTVFSSSGGPANQPPAAEAAVSPDPNNGGGENAADSQDTPPRDTPPRDAPPSGGGNGSGNPSPPPPRSTGFTNSFAFASPSFVPSVGNFGQPTCSVCAVCKPDPPPISSQDVDAECANCNKSFTYQLPKPWPMMCNAQVLPCINNKVENMTAEQVIKELFKDIKCDHCKQLLKKKLQELHKRSKCAQNQKKNTRQSK